MNGWFPQEYATEFYYLKGAVALTATVALIVHMQTVWTYVVKLGQRLRYLTLLYFAVLITYASVEQIRMNELVDSRNVASLFGVVLLIVTMAVSVHEDRPRQ